MRERRISRICLFALLLLGAGASPAQAQNKQDLYNLAMAAAAAGRIDESVKFYCEVARKDPKYKDAKLMCRIMDQERQSEDKKNEERFVAGVQNFDAGKYDEAEQKFRNIRFGPRHEEAQQYLKVKIPLARQAVASKPKEAEKKPQ